MHSSYSLCRHNAYNAYAMPLKPWICWKAAATSPKEAPPLDELELPRLKRLMQLKALQTKCHQRQVELPKTNPGLEEMEEDVCGIADNADIGSNMIMRHGFFWRMRLFFFTLQDHRGVTIGSATTREKWPTGRLSEEIQGSRVSKLVWVSKPTTWFLPLTSQSCKVSLRQRQESLKHLSERRNRAQQALLPREQGNLDDPGESGDVKGF